MTVLLGFTSPAYKTSFMGSDDIESANETPKNKVGLLFNRFLIGCLGDNTTFGALAALDILDQNTVFLDGTKYLLPTSTDEICMQVIRILPIAAEHTRKTLDMAIKNKIYEGNWVDMMKDLKSTLFIIDTVNYTIDLAEFGRLYYAREYSYKLIRLVTERALRVGPDYPFKVMGRLTVDVLSDPFKWCSHKVDETREEVKHIAKFGKLGACYLVSPEGVKSKRVPLPRSNQSSEPHGLGPFQSLEDVARKLFPDPDTLDPNSLTAL